MRTVLCFVLAVLMTAVAYGQPPQGGKFGVGKGQFGDPAKMVQMREQMRARWQAEKPDVEKRPGPPPWAGRGMMMRGPRGPQPPFLGRGPQNQGPRADLRRGGPDHKISGNHHRGGEWRGHRGNKHSHPGVEKSKHRGDHKSRDRKDACCCKDCPKHK